MNDYSQLMNEYSFGLFFNIRLYHNSLFYAESCIYNLIHSSDSEKLYELFITYYLNHMS